MKNKNGRTKKTTIIIIFILVGFICILGACASYALFTTTLKGNQNYVINSGELQLYLDESKTLTDVIQDNAIPISDTDGRKTVGYTFSLKNNDTMNLSYQIYIVEDAVANKTPSNDIRLFYTRDYGNIQVLRNLSTTNTSDKKLLESGIIGPNTTYNYNLKLWISSDAGNEILGTSYSCHLEIEAVQNFSNTYADDSGANIPDLASNMIPVTYDGSNWIKADTSHEWYDYNKQEWANAVTVSETNRNKYLTSSTGTVIPIADINTMWVWIPRYEYENITSTTATEIKVNFLSGTSKTATTKYYVHPAFTFGDEELTGIWVAKFETSSDQSCTAINDSIGTNCDVTTLSPIIKPNVTSWRGIRTSTAFTVSRNMESTNNIYGFNASEMDTHMMKNTEWGAATYLSQSKYGKYGNSNYSGSDKEIAVNNCSSYITGIAGDTVIAEGSTTTCTTNTYNTSKGQSASTTGNIYGIYDMSGGVYEYMMGVMQDNTNVNNPMSGETTSRNSGFTGKVYASGSFIQQSGISFPEKKYYDLYAYGTTYNDAAAYVRNIKGDATTETKEWYTDGAYFVTADNPWFVRSGSGAYSEGELMGIYAFGRSAGRAYLTIGFRLTLVK